MRFLNWLFNYDLISESFDSPLKYSQKQISIEDRLFLTGEFEINDKRFNYIIEKIESENKAGFNFSQQIDNKPSMLDTDNLSSKEALAVFSTIIKIVDDFIKNNKNTNILEFSATTLKKASIYLKIIKKIASEDWNIFHSNYIDFTLVKKDFKVNLKTFKQKYIKIKHKMLSENSENLSILI